MDVYGLEAKMLQLKFRRCTVSMMATQDQHYNLVLGSMQSISEINFKHADERQCGLLTLHLYVFI